MTLTGILHEINYARRCITETHNRLTQVAKILITKIDVLKNLTIDHWLLLQNY